MAKRKAKKAKPPKQAKARVDRWVEQHGATEPFTIFDHGKATATGARRRVTVAAIERALDDRQRQAWSEAESGWLQLARGLGARTSSVEGRIDNRNAESNSLTGLLVDLLVRWGRECTLAKPMIDYACVRSVLFDGAYQTFTEADRGHRRRNGWAARQVKAALDLWADLRDAERRAKREPATIGAQLGAVT